MKDAVSGIKTASPRTTHTHVWKYFDTFKQCQCEECSVKVALPKQPKPNPLGDAA